MAGQQNQIETVFNFINAIFYCDTGHRLVTPYGGTCPRIRLLGIPWRMEFQAFLSWFSLNRLLPDGISAGKPTVRDFVGTAFAQVAAELIEGATMLC